MQARGTPKGPSATPNFDAAWDCCTVPANVEAMDGEEAATDDQVAQEGSVTADGDASVGFDSAAEFDEFTVVGFDHFGIDDELGGIQEDSGNGAADGGGRPASRGSNNVGRGDGDSSLTDELLGYQIYSRGFKATSIDGKTDDNLNSLYFAFDRKLFERQKATFHGKPTFVCHVVRVEESTDDNEAGAWHLFYHDDRDGAKYRGWWVTGGSINNRDRPALFSSSDVDSPEHAKGWVSFPGHQPHIGVVRTTIVRVRLLAVRTHGLPTLL